MVTCRDPTRDVLNVAACTGVPFSSVTTPAMVAWHCGMRPNTVTTVSVARLVTSPAVATMSKEKESSGASAGTRIVIWRDCPELMLLGTLTFHPAGTPSAAMPTGTVGEPAGASTATKTEPVDPGLTLVSAGSRRTTMSSSPDTVTCVRAVASRPRSSEMRTATG